MLHSLPPRTRVVPIDQPDFTGDMVIVTSLPETATPSKLRALISGDQLAVSHDGLVVGYVLNGHRGEERLFHSRLGLLGLAFLRPVGRTDEGVRIISITHSEMLVWGRVEGSPAGIWRLSQGDSEFLGRLDKRLPPLKGSAGPMFRGVNTHHPDEILHLMPWGGLYPTSRDASVSPHRDGLSVIETLEGHSYAYLIDSLGTSPFVQVTPEDTQSVIGCVIWQGHLMLLVRRASQSWLVDARPQEVIEGLSDDRIRVWYRKHRIAIDGELVNAWPSPCGRTLALLVRPRLGEYNRLELLTQDCERELVSDVDDEWRPEQLVWSDSENVLSLRPQGYREMLIDERSRHLAWIDSLGPYDRVMFPARSGHPVPLAWNLHQAPDGAIVWTSVLDREVVTWVYRGTRQSLYRAA